MTATDLTLNIAVNMGRLGRWAADGNTRRINMFLDETEQYLKELENSSPKEKFKPTLEFFKRKFQSLKNNKTVDDAWAEEALTWANILTHRAKLA